MIFQPKIINRNSSFSKNTTEKTDNKTDLHSNFLRLRDNNETNDKDKETKNDGDINKNDLKSTVLKITCLNKNEDDKASSHFQGEASNLTPSFRVNESHTLKNKMSSIIDMLDKAQNGEKKLSIATLDFDGNYSVYKNNKDTLLFNIYDIQNIDNIYKEKTFFGSGFPYYITFNMNYHCISTDHGAFVFTKEYENEFDDAKD